MSREGAFLGRADGNPPALPRAPRLQPLYLRSHSSPRHPKRTTRLFGVEYPDPRLKFPGATLLSQNTGISSKPLRVAGSQFGNRKALGVSVLPHPCSPCTGSGQFVPHSSPASTRSVDTLARASDIYFTNIVSDQQRHRRAPGCLTSPMPNLTPSVNPVEPIPLGQHSRV